MEIPIKLWVENWKKKKKKNNNEKVKARESAYFTLRGK